MNPVVILVASVICAAIGFFLGKHKDRQTEGLVLGLLLGLIGLVILAFLKPKNAAAGPAGAFWSVPPGYATAPTVMPTVAEATPQQFQPAAEAQAPAPQVQSAPPVAAPEAVPAQWLADPSGRHQHRWWSGSAWTEHVANNGVPSVDAPASARAH